MRALITGITGQDGRLLSSFLLDKDYEVYGLIRGQDNPKRDLVDPRVRLFEGDLTDFHSLANAMYMTQPDEVYNLGAITHVGASFGVPELTANVTGLGCLRMLEAIRQVDYCDHIKFYQASTSELFGKVRESPQNEETPFHPRSPYGVAKAFAHYTTVNYRESYDLHASCGILFNHESHLRGYEFITRKVTQGVARIYFGLQEYIELGNLDSKRDWGYAGEYVEAMWLMLQQKDPDDYVIATGKMHSIEDLLIAAFRVIGLEQEWPKYIKRNSKYMRPAEVDHLQGDASKAKQKLGWKPKWSFDSLIEMMVRTDLDIEGAKIQRSGKV